MEEYQRITEGGLSIRASLFFPIQVFVGNRIMEDQVLQDSRNPLKFRECISLPFYRPPVGTDSI
jgi:hypothetical protein